ncbi:unnamed protein product [Arctia plantaginis]|uniref:Uncharacterized protein n=1 Tax=Arctia plantaginis TaxID=874455 RepID=A0A8S1BMQ9_ARCPL|nr:unnamed protein product [Arctia plantaginis]
MEWLITDDGKYRIESLSAATFHGALRVIKESFCQDETVSIGTEINKNETAADELLELCADAALDGVSAVAVHIETGEVAAAAFNKLQVATTDPSEKPFFEIFAAERCTQASSRALIEFMADVDGRCNLFEKFGVDCSLEIMFLATLQHHRFNKLGTILCKISVEIARKLKNGPVSVITVKDFGPKYSFMPEREAVKKVPKIVQAIWTAEPTQKIGKALDFKVFLTVPFTEYSYNGKTFSERVGANVTCEVAAIIL